MKNTHTRQFLLLFCLALLPLSWPQAQDDVEVIVVTGRRPGPPLWTISNGDNTLWILPLVSTVPKDMEWDDARVADLIATADEIIDEPNVTLGIPKGVLLNPFNAVRAMRLWNRLRENPDGAELADVLPPDLYARYAAFKSGYFPRDRDIESMRPSFAAQEVFKNVLDAERLTDAQTIKQQVERHIRRNRDVVRTEVNLVHTVEGGFGELRDRAEDMTGSLQVAREIACFDRQIGVLEQHLNAMKVMANAWANGSAAALDEYREPVTFDDPCAALLLDSTEGELLLQLQLEARARWLAAAEAALERNHSTFAMLPFGYVAGDASLVDALAARGYIVHDPR